MPFDAVLNDALSALSGQPLPTLPKGIRYVLVHTEGKFCFDSDNSDAFRRYDYDQRPYMQDKLVLVGDILPLQEASEKHLSVRVSGYAYPRK